MGALFVNQRSQFSRNAMLLNARRDRFVSRTWCLWNALCKVARHLPDGFALSATRMATEDALEVRLSWVKDGVPVAHVERVGGRAIWAKGVRVVGEAVDRLAQYAADVAEGLAP